MGTSRDARTFFVHRAFAACSEVVAGLPEACALSCRRRDVHDDSARDTATHITAVGTHPRWRPSRSQITLGRGTLQVPLHAVVSLVQKRRLRLCTYIVMQHGISRTEIWRLHVVKVIEL